MCEWCKWNIWKIHVSLCVYTCTQLLTVPPETPTFLRAGPVEAPERLLIFNRTVVQTNPSARMMKITAGDLLTTTILLWIFHKGPRLKRELIRRWSEIHADRRSRIRSAYAIDSRGICHLAIAALMPGKKSTGWMPQEFHGGKISDPRIRSPPAGIKGAIPKNVSRKNSQVTSRRRYYIMGCNNEPKANVISPKERKDGDGLGAIVSYNRKPSQCRFFASRKLYQFISLTILRKAFARLSQTQLIHSIW